MEFFKKAAVSMVACSQLKDEVDEEDQ